MELAREQTRADKQKVVREVKRVYYALQQVESGLRTARQTVALYKELARLTENYVAGEVVLKADLLEVQTRLAKAEQSESLLLDQQATAKEQLNQLLGRDISTDFQVQPVARPRRRSALDWKRRASEPSSSGRRSVRRSCARRRPSRTCGPRRPNTSPTWRPNSNSMTLPELRRYFPRKSHSVGISVTWEPFDWGRKKHEAAEKQRTVDQARNTPAATPSTRC